MSKKIWELHDIKTTPEGDADIDGLFLSEKAYFVAVQDFRPQQLLEMVRRESAAVVAARLIEHYGTEERKQAAGGRCLVSARSTAPVPVLKRSDEVAAPVGSPGT